MKICSSFGRASVDGASLFHNTFFMKAWEAGGLGCCLLWRRGEAGRGSPRDGIMSKTQLRPRVGFALLRSARRLQVCLGRPVLWPWKEGVRSYADHHQRQADGGHASSAAAH
jgi:hypothetical protein